MKQLRKDCCIPKSCWASLLLLLVVGPNALGQDGAANTVSTESAEKSDRFLESAIGEYAAAMDANGRDARIAAFGRAEQLFTQVVESIESEGRQASASLWVNLGNSAIQAGNTGKAILAYRRALEREPGHSQALQNLSFARASLPDWARRESEDALTDTLFFWRNLYSNDQIYLFMGIVFFLAALLVAIGIATKRSLLRNLAAVPVLLWAVLFASVVFDNSNSKTEGVINSEYSMLHSADSENSPFRLANPLPDGTEVEILQERERWTEVRISGKTGWVRSSNIARI